MIDACDKLRARTPAEIDRGVFELLCEWRDQDHKDKITLTRNEVCSIIEHCRRQKT